MADGQHLRKAASNTSGDEATERAEIGHGGGTEPIPLRTKRSGSRLKQGHLEAQRSRQHPAIRRAEAAKTDASASDQGSNPPRVPGPCSQLLRPGGRKERSRAERVRVPANRRGDRYAVHRGPKGLLRTMGERIREHARAHAKQSSPERRGSTGPAQVVSDEPPQAPAGPWC